MFHSINAKDRIVKMCEETSEIHSEILQSGKFWKLAQSKSPAVRMAWYEVISTLCQYQAEIGVLESKQMEKIGSAIFNQLDDWTDVVLSTKVWDSMIRFTTNKNWTKHIDVEKKVLPKLLSVLEGKIRGHSNMLMYSYLLPFLSTLPKQNADFYATFFTCLKNGIANQKTATSPRGGLLKSSDSDKLAAAFFECSLFSLKFESENEEIVNVVLDRTKDFVNDVGLGCLASDNHENPQKSVLKCYANTLSTLKSKSEAPYVKDLWKHFGEICTKLNEISTDSNSTNNRIALDCLQLLIVSYQSEKRLQKGLAFASDDGNRLKSCQKTSSPEGLNRIVTQVASNTLKTVIFSDHPCDKDLDHVERQIKFLADLFNQNSDPKFYNQLVLAALGPTHESDKPVDQLLTSLMALLSNFKPLFGAYCDVLFALGPLVQSEQMEALLEENLAQLMTSEEYDLVDVLLKKMSVDCREVFLSMSTGHGKKTMPKIVEIFEQCLATPLLTSSTPSRFGMVTTILETAGKKTKFVLLMDDLNIVCF